MKRTTDAPSLKMEVATNFNSLETMREDWDAFVEKTDSDIYMTYDWCRVWWKYYGGNKQLRIYLYRLDNQLKAILPLYIDSMGCGPASIRIARIIAADCPPNAIILPIEEACQTDVYEITLNHLFCQENCDTVLLGPLSGVTHQADSLRNVIQETSHRLLCQKDASRDVQTVFKIANDFETFFQALPKKRRKLFRSKTKVFSKQHSVRLEFLIPDSDSEDLFNEFANMHHDQWQKKGFRGHFGSWPKALEFNREMARVQASRNRLRIFRTLADEIPVGSRYYYAFNGRYHLKLAARLTGMPWDQFNLGDLGFVHVAEDAINHGIYELDSGLGQYDFKRWWGADEYPATCLLITRNRLASRLRGTLLSFLSRVLEIGYYKIWYVRLARKFPRLRRPIWNVFLRFRI